MFNNEIQHADIYIKYIIIIKTTKTILKISKIILKSVLFLSLLKVSFPSVLASIPLLPFHRRLNY